MWDDDVSRKCLVHKPCFPRAIVWNSLILHICLICFLTSIGLLVLLSVSLWELLSPLGFNVGVPHNGVVFP